MIYININNLQRNTNARDNTLDQSINNVEVISPSDVGKLDQNAFLKMMLTQLQNQDPLSPMDTNAFSTQMAQFASVEQLSSISSKLDDLSELVFMSLLPEAPTQDSSNEDSTVNNTPSESEETSDKDAKMLEKKLLIKRELENLKSITLKTDFDYTSKDLKNLNSKLSNLISHSN